MFGPTHPVGILERLWSKVLLPLYHEAHVAESVPQISQSSWQRSVVETFRFANDHPIGFGFIGAAFAGAGGVLGATIPHSLFWQIVLGAVGGALGFGVAVGVILLAHFALAPYWQRDEARLYAAALEQFGREYVSWAGRREIAESFRTEIIEQATQVVGTENDHRTPEEVEEWWRGRLTSIRELLRHWGAADAVFVEIDNGLERLDAETTSTAMITYAVSGITCLRSAKTWRA